jgi:hypothetical protein
VPSTRTRLSASWWRHQDVSTSYRLRRRRSTVPRCTQSAPCRPGHPYRRGPHHADACCPNSERCLAASPSYANYVRLVGGGTFQTLILALVLIRLCYANSVLVGLPAYRVQRLQSVLNALARLIYGLGDTITCQTRSSRFTD